MMASPTSDGHGHAEGVLEQILQDLVEAFDGTFSAESINVDVDVLEGSDVLVEGQDFDSMDLVVAVGVIEERYDVSLATLLSGDEQLTLRAVAQHIAASGRSAGDL